MPELIVPHASPPTPMVCMYCGCVATTSQTWEVARTNPEANGGGADIALVPGGDDPASAVVGLLMLPFVLWELLKGLAAAVGAVVGYARPRRQPVPDRPVPPPPAVRTTRVAVTTCDGHRRFHDRFVWVGTGLVVGLIGLWVWAILVTRRDMGTDHVDLAVTLMLTAVFATVLLPVAFGIWRFVAGPVIVDRVTEQGVVLDRVRPAYFAATGQPPDNQ
jgi:hypothetical protein